MKNLFVATSLSMSISIFAAIDVLDRVAIIVDEGVIMESQLQDRLQNTKIMDTYLQLIVSSYLEYTLDHKGN